jgi:hypothetical protein
MISLPSRLPLLVVGPGESTTYEKQWVVDAIESAARAAGHKDGWWFAPDIARSLLVYLEDRYEGTTVTIEDLAARIRHTLKSIGFHEIGQNLALQPPPLTLSLSDLASESSGSPLHFFALLDTRLNELSALGVRCLCLTNARPGVKFLTNSRHWSPRCQQLISEIRHFLDARSRSLPNVAITVSPD